MQNLSFEYEAPRRLAKEEVLPIAIEELCKFIGVTSLPSNITTSIFWEWSEGNMNGYQICLEEI